MLRAPFTFLPFLRAEDMVLSSINNVPSQVAVQVRPNVWDAEEEERDAEWIGRLISIGSAGIEHISRNFKQVELGITTSRCNPPAEKTRRWWAWVLGLAPTCQLPVQNTKKVQHPMWLENSPSTGLLTLKAVCLPVDWIMLLQVKLLITLKNSGPRLNRMGKIYVYALN